MSWTQWERPPKDFAPSLPKLKGGETMPMTPKSYVSVELENRYSYHSPKEDQPKRYEALRAKAKELAHMIDELCPNSREKSSAQTNLQQAIMWANASIAINE